MFDFNQDSPSQNYNNQESFQTFEGNQSNPVPEQYFSLYQQDYSINSLEFNPYYGTNLNTNPNTFGLNPYYETNVNPNQNPNQTNYTFNDLERNFAQKDERKHKHKHKHKHSHKHKHKHKHKENQTKVNWGEEIEHEPTPLIPNNQLNYEEEQKDKLTFSKCCYCKMVTACIFILTAVICILVDKFSS
ncbi:zinc transporter slc39a7 [Anaeramoeba ignava]|uniref:Zinc transporter slc39a7 n=1 Tax=Anaeramoeba ignava TaxID=1746090 RepID=A0A9Q0LM73_ANAIG|nr:zinc transporter slc39a7 [Anaeramoeba ignava]